MLFMAKWNSARELSVSSGPFCVFGWWFLRSRMGADAQRLKGLFGRPAVRCSATFLFRASVRKVRECSVQLPDVM